ncbi:MAG TPA: DnaJ domain-containing protein [Rectinemataceae bacterium]|nr:DnaJ domain-containing protein [Rectinemataceae bacterium]
MISDFRILGIAETDDIQAIKSAFRRRAKELHPDVRPAGEALERHDLFVEVCRAYRRLLDRSSSPSPQSPSPPRKSEKSRAGPQGGDLPSRYSDQAYAFYKAGMKHYMMIHPSHWHFAAGEALTTPIAGHEEEQRIIRQKVMDLVKLFPKAYYYFSIVAHEYPDSDWAYDAKRKMSLIEERIGRYRKIIESFSAWSVDKKELAREYREKFGDQEATKKSVRKDEPAGWKD